MNVRKIIKNIVGVIMILAVIALLIYGITIGTPIIAIGGILCIRFFIPVLNLIYCEEDK